MPWSRALEKLIVTQLVKKFIFMEPKGLLLCSQEPTTIHSLVPDESRPHLPTSPVWCPPIYAYIFHVVSSLQVLWPKVCMHFPCNPSMLHALPILNFVALIMRWVFLSFPLSFFLSTTNSSFAQPDLAFLFHSHLWYGNAPLLLLTWPLPNPMPDHAGFLVDMALGWDFLWVL